jgi:hypothetical protein
MRRNIALTLVAVLIAAVMLPLLATSEASADTWAGVAAEGIVGDYNTPQAQAACSAVYNGLLYVGTRSVSGCEVWSYDGATWTSIADPGFGDGDNRAVTAMAVYGPNLYAGTYRQFGGCQLWRYDGSAWTRVSGPLLEVPHNSYVSSMADFSGMLVVGTANDKDAARTGHAHRLAAGLTNAFVSTRRICSARLPPRRLSRPNRKSGCEPLRGTRTTVVSPRPSRPAGPRGPAFPGTPRRCGP